MRLSTLPRFLFGSRRAIEQVADSPYALACGLLFVLSAGLAREYDGEDLLHEPWHALRPLGASLTLAAILFLLVDPVARLRARKTGAQLPGFAPAFRSFLAVYWMTAPLAWLYAIPYERFLSPVDAVRVNLWTLAAVSVWRVLLMTRAISVLYGVNPIAVFFIVMFFGDALVFSLAQALPTPIIDLMGGLRHTERDALIANLTFTLWAWSFLSSPVWIVGAIAACFALKPRGRTPAQPEPSRALLVFAAASIFAWIPALIVAQPEQMRKHRAETLLRWGEIAQAFEEMSARSPDDYPPHWDPPPRLGYGERTPDLADVRAAMERQWPAPWVAEIYLDKIERAAHEAITVWGDGDWHDVVEKKVFIHDAIEDQREAIAFLLEHDESLTPDDREALEQLLELAAE